MTKRTDLLVQALLVPVYWVMMSVAAMKALLQLVISPSYWEKTMHGLHLGRGHDSAPPETREPRGDGVTVNVHETSGVSH